MKTSPKILAGICCGLALTVGAAERTTTYTYTAEGLISSIDGPRADVTDLTTFTYDTAGNRATMTNVLGHITQYTDYDGAGRLLRMVGPNGRVTSFTYHPRGWLLSQATSTTVLENKALWSPLQVLDEVSHGSESGTAL